MTRATIRGLIALTVLVSGCPPQNTVPMLPAACTVPQSSGPSGGGTTMDFIVSSIAIELDDGRVPTHSGFDLDGHVSTARDEEGCGREDVLASSDPRENLGCCPVVPRDGGACRGGVDNQLPRLMTTIQQAVGFDRRADTAARIADGRLLLAIRLHGVDDMANDPDVAIALLYVFDADGDCTNNHVAGARFIADDASFLDGDPARPRWRSDGFIENGRFRTRTAFTATLRLPLGTDLDTVQTSASRVAFDVVPTASNGANGNFGGWVPGRNLVEAMLPIVAPTPQYRDAVDVVVAELTDIRVDGHCAENNAGIRTYGGVSMGYAFDLIGVAPIVGHAMQPSSGACGSTGANDAGSADATRD